MALPYPIRIHEQSLSGTACGVELFDLNTRTKQALARIEDFINERALQEKVSIQAGFIKLAMQIPIHRYTLESGAHNILANFSTRQTLKVGERVVMSWPVNETIDENNFKIDIPYIVWLWLRSTSVFRICKTVWYGVGNKGALNK